MRLGQEVRRMPLGLPHDSKDLDENDTIFFGVRMRSCTPIRNSNFISVSFLDNRDDEYGKHGLGLQELEVLDEKHLQTQQQIKLYQA